MKKIVMLTCLEAAGSCCTGAACFQAFQERTGGFARYGDEDLQLAAFMHCNGCGVLPEADKGLQEKIDRILSIHPDAVHLGVCTQNKDGTRCPVIAQIMTVFQEHGIPVINGTHKSANLTDIGAVIPKK